QTGLGANPRFVQPHLARLINRSIQTKINPGVFDDMISQVLKPRRAAIIGLTLAIGAGCALVAHAQNAPAPAPAAAPAAGGGANAARQAADVRKSIFKLI